MKYVCLGGKNENEKGKGEIIYKTGLIALKSHFFCRIYERWGDN